MLLKACNQFVLQMQCWPDAVVQARTAVFNLELFKMPDKIERAKCLITFEELKKIAKTTLPSDDPNAEIYLSEDYIVILTSYKKFFLAVAEKTQRLNHIAVTRMATDRWKLNGHSAGLLGKAFATAYNTCMKVGSKATTGEKLSKTVVEIFTAAHGGSLTCKEEAVSAKKELKLKQELATVKAETPSTGKRKLKKEDSDSSCGPILSPRRLQSLYSMPVSIKELFSL